MADQIASEYDVLVLGTGAAGMTAALAAAASGANVGVFEKADTVGGTTAVSGGYVWIPWHTTPFSGPELTRQGAKDYLDALSLGFMDDQLVDAFIDSGQPLLDFIHEHTLVRFEVEDGVPDYHAEFPGGCLGGGRTMRPGSFPFTKLGEWADRVTRFPTDGPGIGIDAESRAILRMRLGDEQYTKLEQSDHRFMGEGLIGGLLRALLDRSIEPHTGYRAVDLVIDSDGVRGVTFESAGQRTTVATRRVIVATGGFEWDAHLVKTFLQGPMVGPASPPYNDGDALRMMMKADAQLWNMGDAWWAPVINIPGDEWRGQPRFRTVRFERARPRAILVNRQGERFVNEATNYNDLGKVFHVFDPDAFAYRNAPAWLIIDHEHLVRYGFLGITSDTDPIPDWCNRSLTLSELAERTGIDAARLHLTIKAWNENVGHLTDPQFHRGESAFDGFWGDQSQSCLPAKTLGPIDQAPFYAVRIELGCLGTKGGPRVNTNAQVLHMSGRPIEGLYAAGNAMAAVTGQAYGGGGGTIGPAMVWGLRAGVHAACGHIPFDTNSPVDSLQ